MTEYQKKKLIDLALIVIGIVVVGFFLKTQLEHPILIDVESPSATESDKNYRTGSNFETDENLNLPDYADLKAVSVLIDNAYIDIIIDLRGIPENVLLGDNTYDFSIYFDVNEDDASTEDIVVTHGNIDGGNPGKSEAPLDDEAVFLTTIREITKEPSEILGAGEAVVDGNSLFIRIPYSKKLGISEKTPLKVIVTHQIDQVTISDEMP